MQTMRYQLMSQLARITAERGALTNDKRLNSLAIAIQYWVDSMAQDVEVRMGASREKLMISKLDRLREQASMA